MIENGYCLVVSTHPVIRCFQVLLSNELKLSSQMSAPRRGFTLAAKPSATVRAKMVAVSSFISSRRM